jgi:hypothetical protein
MGKFLLELKKKSLRGGTDFRLEEVFSKMSRTLIAA